MNIKINTNASQTDPMLDRHATFLEITIHHNVLVIAENVEVLANLQCIASTLILITPTLAE